MDSIIQLSSGASTHKIYFLRFSLRMRPCILLLPQPSLLVLPTVPRGVSFPSKIV